MFSSLLIQQYTNYHKRRFEMRTKLFTSLLAVVFLASSTIALHANTSNLDKLSDGLAKVKEKGYMVLAPENYKKADQKLDEARRHAKKKKRSNSEKAAKAGMKYLNQANKHANVSMEALQEALTIRDKAIESGAPDYFRDKFRNVDNQLKDATRNIERGKIDAAKKRQPELMKKYSELEIESLKKGTVDLAKSKIKHAKQDGASGEAPETLKLAVEQLTLAKSVLEANRSNTKKADKHANRAVRLAEKAAEITTLSKMFQKYNYQTEDIILWYHDLLQVIFFTIKDDIHFNQPHRMLETNLKNSIDSLIENQIATNELLEKKQARIAELEQQLNKQLSETKQAQLAEQRNKQRFTDVQAQFDKEEASVFRKGDDILISAHGFFFAVGGSEISTSNFTLLNKVASAIRQFPGSSVKISGHTDSTGNTKKNLELSIKRAKNVGIFLTEVGMLEASRISTEGFGDTTPVANNKTVEGRSLNRRIEVYIKNNE
jgi:outer membrane protein OmpA-like peptidoglycan-associated protein